MLFRGLVIVAPSLFLGKSFWVAGNGAFFLGVEDG
jgi:hypothetical protein